MSRVCVDTMQSTPSNLRDTLPPSMVVRDTLPPSLMEDNIPPTLRNALRDMDTLPPNSSPNSYRTTVMRKLSDGKYLHVAVAEDGNVSTFIRSCDDTLSKELFCEMVKACQKALTQIAAISRAIESSTNKSLRELLCEKREKIRKDMVENIPTEWLDDVNAEAMKPANGND
jgi:hypothetical protein